MNTKESTTLAELPKAPLLFHWRKIRYLVPAIRLGEEVKSISRKALKVHQERRLNGRWKERLRSFHPGSCSRVDVCVQPNPSGDDRLPLALIDGLLPVWMHYRHVGLPPIPAIDALQAKREASQYQGLLKLGIPFRRHQGANRECGVDTGCEWSSLA